MRPSSYKNLVSRILEENWEVEGSIFKLFQAAVDQCFILKLQLPVTSESRVQMKYMNSPGQEQGKMLDCSVFSGAELGTASAFVESMEEDAL